MAVAQESQRAYLKLLLTIMQKTPHGGASISDLQEAYEEVTDKWPTERTIYRYLHRLELFFDPLAGQEIEDDEEELAPPLMGITRDKRGRKTYYRFNGDIKLPALDFNEAVIAALNFYPQQGQLLKESFDAICRHLLKDVVAGISMYSQVIDVIQRRVHVAGPLPVDLKRHTQLLQDIFAAIRRQQPGKMEYLRTYDGAMTHRTVEPFGLVNRMNHWYLAARCRESDGIRIFSIAHIHSFEILEGPGFIWPERFALDTLFKHSWGTWTEARMSPVEDVILRVEKGAAERFRAVQFHRSQTVKELPGSAVEVSFRLAGAEEMVSWLLGWGTKVTVLKPEWLREHVRTTAGVIVEQYAPAKSPQ